MKKFKFKKLKADDVKEVFPLLNDSDIKPYLSGLYCKNIKEAKSTLKHFTSLGNELYEILDCNDKIIGLLAYEHIDAESIELSFLISKEFRSKHYSSQSLKDFLLELPNLHPSVKDVYFFVDEKNTKSKKVVESIGAQYSHTFEDEDLVYKKSISKNNPDEQSL